MDQMIVTAALAAALLAPAAGAGETPKAAAAARTRAEAKELRLDIKKDKQALKQDWLDGRREMGVLRAQETQARKAGLASNAAPEPKKEQLDAIAKKFAMARASVRARRGPARIALKQKLKSDQTRHKSMSKAR